MGHRSELGSRKRLNRATLTRDFLRGRDGEAPRQVSRGRFNIGDRLQVKVSGAVVEGIVVRGDDRRHPAMVKTVDGALVVLNDQTRRPGFIETNSPRVPEGDLR